MKTDEYVPNTPENRKKLGDMGYKMYSESTITYPFLTAVHGRDKVFQGLGNEKTERFIGYTLYEFPKSNTNRILKALREKETDTE